MINPLEFIDENNWQSYYFYMIKKYKTAAYQFDSEQGLTDKVIIAIDEWLNSWLAAGYFIDKVTEITKNGKCSGFFYVFKQIE